MDSGISALLGPWAWSSQLCTQHGPPENLPVAPSKPTEGPPKKCALNCDDHCTVVVVIRGRIFYIHGIRTLYLTRIELISERPKRIEFMVALSCGVAI